MDERSLPTLPHSVLRDERSPRDRVSKSAGNSRQRAQKMRSVTSDMRLIDELQTQFSH